MLKLAARLERIQKLTRGAGARAGRLGRRLSIGRRINREVDAARAALRTLDTRGPKR
jgi:hypothetical protein